MPLNFPVLFERFSDKVRENKRVIFTCRSTMSESDKANNNENARNVRLGRQMSSIPQIENSGDTDNLYVAPNGRVKIRKRNIRKVTSFENLPDAVNESNNNDGKETSLSPMWIGSISVIGRRRDMEDALTVSPVIFPGDHEFYDFFAVYDGHGGSAVANACRDRLHKLLEEELEGSTGGCGGGGLDWEKLMAACFAKMDEEITGSGAYLKLANSLSVTTLGSTAVVVVVGKDVLVVANCGDSRAILCRGGVPIPLSRDHKPNNPDERERVEAAGGCVVDWDGYRVSGVLATSRSIGDVHLKPCVISEPEVTVSERTASDDFIIIATDGLWDVVSNESACVIVRRCLAGKLKTRFLVGSNGSPAAVAAATLAEMAMARGSRDNISAIVVQLKMKA